MKNLVLVLAALAASCSAQNNSLPKHFTDISFSEFHYSPPDPKDFRSTLEDGTVLYMIPAPQLPLIRLELHWVEKNMPASPDQVAGLGLLGSLLRRGGAGNLSATTVDDSLDFLASYASVGIGSYSSTLSVDVISKDFEAVFDMALNMILKPKIDSLRLEQQKEKLVQSIRHRHDRPANLLSDLFGYLTYGKHPLNWTSTEEEAAAVKREDLLKLRPGRFSSKKLIIGISGDFEPKKIREQVEKGLKHLRAGLPQGKTPAEVPVRFHMKPGIFLVDKDVSQANIRLGQPFVKRPHPDYYPATVASYILGAGGFTSRLPVRVRSDEGLAYSVYSFTGSSYHYARTSGVALQTKVESAAFALKIIYEEIRRMTKEGITSDELKRAQDGLIGSIPGIFDTPDHTVNRFVTAEAWGRKLDHYKVYPDKIRAVSKADVKRILELYFQPEKMSVAIVGPVKELLKKDEKHAVSLEMLGKVKVLTVEELDRRD